MNSYSDLTLKYLKQNKKRTLLTIIGIILAISLFSGIGTFMYSTQNSLIENKKQQTGNWEFGFCNMDDNEAKKLSNNFEIKNYCINTMSTKLKIKGDNSKTVIFSESDNNCFNLVFTTKSLEGRAPRCTGEILLSKNAIRVLHKKLGDTIQLLEKDSFKSYKIVGFNKDVISGDEIVGEAYFNSSKLDKNKLYNVYVNLKQKNHKREIANKIATKFKVNINPQNKEDYKKSYLNVNEGLLDLMGQSGDPLFNSAILKILGIIIGIIIICTIAVIYNAFNISVAERINQFGILRSIGATPRKIRKLVFKEAFIMGGIAIPFGILSGYLGIYITMYFLSKSKFFIFDNIKIGFFPQVIIISIILGMITILLSVMGPAKVASKIAPIDAITNSSNIKKEKYKRRRTFFIKLIFGIEGDIAYKNIRRNNKRFLITIFSLVISLVMFNVFTASVRNFKTTAEQLVDKMEFEGNISQMQCEKCIDPKFIDELRNKNEISKIATSIQGTGSLYIKSKFLNNTYYNKTILKKPQYVNLNKEEYVKFQGIRYCVYDKQSLDKAKKYLISGSIDENALNNGGVLLVDTNQAKSKEKKKIVDRIFKYKVGDEIKIPNFKNIFYVNNEPENLDKMAKDAIEKNNFTKVKVVGILSRDIFHEKFRRNEASLIFSKQNFIKNVGEYKPQVIGFEFKDENSREKVQNYLSKKCQELKLDYMDIYLLTKQMNSINNQMDVFVYGFITIITFIGIVNIINTITIGLLLRKSEFATLTSIGMTKKQLSKMVMLEGILHGVIASIVGTIMSYGLYTLMMNAQRSYMEMPPKSPIDIFVLGAIGSISITLIASLIPLKKLKNMSIVENIRAKE